ncbi:hypothetical protein C2G38_2218127 [Gigaspora rosea]|uniref:Uncharacterized protein n=1 Tax=Gigaspora rosea TaxID=44941 RepID=A0A397UAA2_9GLOM|nr:hypothetical protein C2G38_2218127 [Gigaspora rosea]
MYQKRSYEVPSNMLGAIMDKLNELSKKMNRIERRLSEMDDRFSESFDLAHETNFINVIFIFIS